MKKTSAKKLFAVTLTAATIMAVSVPAFAMSDTSNAVAEQSAGMTEDSSWTVETYEEVITRCEDIISRYIAARNTCEEDWKKAEDSMEIWQNAEDSKENVSSDTDETSPEFQQYIDDLKTWWDDSNVRDALEERIEDMYREVCLCIDDAMNTRAECEKKIDDLEEGMEAEYKYGDYEMYNELNEQYNNLILLRSVAEDTVNNLTQCKNNLMKNMSQSTVNRINKQLAAK